MSLVQLGPAERHTVSHLLGHRSINTIYRCVVISQLSNQGGELWGAGSFSHTGVFIRNTQQHIISPP